jgi:hypothetical protein
MARMATKRVPTLACKYQQLLPDQTIWGVPIKTQHTEKRQISIYSIPPKWGIALTQNLNSNFLTLKNSLNNFF